VSLEESSYFESWTPALNGGQRKAIKIKSYLNGQFSNAKKIPFSLLSDIK